MAIHVKHTHGFSLGLFLISRPQNPPISTYNNTKKHGWKKNCFIYHNREAHVILMPRERPKLLPN